MRLLVTGSAIRGLPVVTIGGGEDVAEVRDVIYSPEAGQAVGLTLNKRGFLAGRSREVLPAETIHAIGRDAVMIDDETGLILPEDAPADVGGPPSGRDVTGDDVLTEQGTSLGKVRDVVVLAVSVRRTGDSRRGDARWRAHALRGQESRSGPLPRSGMDASVA